MAFNFLFLTHTYLQKLFFKKNPTFFSNIKEIFFSGTSLISVSPLPFPTRFRLLSLQKHSPKRRNRKSQP